MDSYLDWAGEWTVTLTGQVSGQYLDWAGEWTVTLTGQVSGQYLDWASEWTLGTSESYFHIHSTRINNHLSLTFYMTLSDLLLFILY